MIFVLPLRLFQIYAYVIADIARRAVELAGSPHGLVIDSCYHHGYFEAAWTASITNKATTAQAFRYWYAGTSQRLYYQVRVRVCVYLYMSKFMRVFVRVRPFPHASSCVNMCRRRSVALIGYDQPSLAACMFFAEALFHTTKIRSNVSSFRESGLALHMVHPRPYSV